MALSGQAPRGASLRSTVHDGNGRGYAEIKELFAARADIVQIDEPYMQARPEKARKFGLAGLNAALDGVRGTTAVHICFGYAAIIHQRPDGCSFLSELAESPVQQVSIETAQSKLDCSVLQKLPGKTIILGTLDLSDMTVEKPETVAARIRRALPYVPAPQIVVAPDCGLKQCRRGPRRRGSSASPGSMPRSMACAAQRPCIFVLVMPPSSISARTALKFQNLPA